MARFFKKKPSLILGLIFFWGFYFFFSPFLHFHPSDVHAHYGELESHFHEGHYHSQELEALAHSWNLHPADTQQDEKRHHPHSSKEHDSDKFDVNVKNTGLKYKNVGDGSKRLVDFNSLVTPPFFSRGTKIFHPNESFLVRDREPFQERSPPL